MSDQTEPKPGSSFLDLNPNSESDSAKIDLLIESLSEDEKRLVIRELLSAYTTAVARANAPKPVRDILGRSIDDFEMTTRLFRALPDNWGSNQTEASLADILGPLNYVRKEADKIEKTVKVILKSVVAEKMAAAKAAGTDLVLSGENYEVTISFTQTARFSQGKAIELGFLTPEQVEASKETTEGERITVKGG